MLVLIKVLIALIMLEHCYILWFEMFAWTSRGPKVFKQLPKELFAPTKPLAANQGLYNGFLAAGLAWTFFITDTLWALRVATFFLGCVSVAGIYGAITADKKIFFVQALPALLTLLLIAKQLLS
jgi:putative membrane protein